MTRQIMAAAGLLASAAAAAPVQQSPTFRARADLVSVSVSVKNRNTPIAGLTRDAFRLFDNGVPQTVESISIEGVPVDLTLFVDTSPSFIGHLADLKDDVREIASLLRAGDRIRLLAFANEVDEVVGWTDSGRAVNLDGLRVARISSVYDGLAASLLHQPELDRRHLIVAITDGIDYSSAVSSARLLEISARVEGVLHLVLMPSSHVARSSGLGQAQMRGPDALGMGRLKAAAEQTGGQLHVPLSGTNVVKAFKQVFDDFRTSYVLRYSPAGVVPVGWHDLKVEVPSAPRATIRARRGYSGG